jgi:2-methylcitrate dehydratase PrpD
MAAKVNAVPDPSLPDEFTPTKVTIRTRRGTFETKTGYARGDMRNPMTFEDMEQKLAGCAALAAVPVPEKNLAEAVSMIKNLEDVKDAERIVRLIAR